MSTTITIDTLTTLANAFVYYFSVRATDLAGNVSQITGSNGITIDTGPPIIGIVNDGLAEDEDYTNSDSTLDLSWAGFLDTISGISFYEYAFFRYNPTSDDSTIIEWTNIGLDTGVTVRNLSLDHDATYYGSIRAIDNVGHVSATALSDGILVDIFSPTVGLPNDGGLEDLDYQGPSDTLAIYWSGADTREISYYQYSVGTTAGDTNCLLYTSPSPRDRG